MLEEQKLRKTFTANLNRLLAKKETTQQALAKFMKVSPSTVNEWTKGKKIPRMDKIDGLCKFFAVNRNDLLESLADKTEKSKNLVLLDDSELAIINTYRNLDKEQKKNVSNIILSVGSLILKSGDITINMK